MITTTEKKIFNFNALSPPEINARLTQYAIRMTIDEVLTLQNDILKRPPTLAELILWSIQGSEHCSYKSSRKYLKTLPCDAPNVILGPKEDAGIVAVAVDAKGKRYGLVVSHESHNHPSQIVPYEGAATGIGGNVRDVSCMGADVIAVADGLRFGEISHPQTQWILNGVVAGIAGYANPLGIANLAGDVYFDAGYNENCLVTVVTLGILAEDEIIHSYVPNENADYVFILVGKPTDQSGFGGASFASNLLQGEELQNKGAIQEPNAFLERHLLKAHAALFKILKEKNLLSKVGFKDLGAGGIACATVELADAASFGAEIDLEKVPTSMDLAPEVILCSETQERFMWVVPTFLSELILQHYNVTFALPHISQGAKAMQIGKVRKDGRYLVHFHGEKLVDAPAALITKGIAVDRKAYPFKKNFSEPNLPPPSDYNTILLQLLAHENIASRAPIYERYDKQVQGRTIIEGGKADAGVMQPFNEEKYPAEIRATGIALSLDQSPRYNKIDPFWGAVNAVYEAVRNVAAVGAEPQAITDCLCFGNPEKPNHMWEFVESIRGIKAACHAIHLKNVRGHALPVIAGNVSFYNEGSNLSIPPSPMIACVGSMPNAQNAITSDLKKIGSTLFLVGERLDECGGSIYYDLYNELGTHVPKPNLAKIADQIYAVIECIRQGLVLSAHDISEGGVAVALAEMSFKNSMGVEVYIPGDTLSTPKKLFCETGGFILEIEHSHIPAVQKIFSKYNTPLIAIGFTHKDPYLKIQNCIHLAIEIAKTTWALGLKKKLQ